jgi:6-phosphogluconolactonase/glucosamine-6-phosphate isomerase/deaminase
VAAVDVNCVVILLLGCGSIGHLSFFFAAKMHFSLLQTNVIG